MCPGLWFSVIEKLCVWNTLALESGPGTFAFREADWKVGGILTPMHGHSGAARYPHENLKRPPGKLVTTRLSPWKSRSRKKQYSAQGNTMYNAIECAMQCNIRRYNTIECNIQYHTTQDNAVQYNAVQYNLARYHKIQLNPIRYNTL